MTAPANLRFLWNNFADVGTIAASSSAANFPASNIQTTFRQQVWQSVDEEVEDVTLTWDMGIPLSFKAAILQDHNYSAEATVTLRASTDNFVADDDLIGTFVMTRTDNGEEIVINPLVLFFSEATYRYWRVTIDDADNADTYLQLGRAFLGGYSEMSKNIMSGWSVTPVDLSEQERSRGGVVHVNEKPVYRILDFTFHVVTITQKDAIRQVMDSRKTSRPFWTHVFPDDSAADQYCIYGRFSRLPRLTNTRWILWDIPVQIAEDV